MPSPNRLLSLVTGGVVNLTDASKLDYDMLLAFHYASNLVSLGALVLGWGRGFALE